MDRICRMSMGEVDFRRKSQNYTWIAYICTEPPKMRFLNEAIVRRAYVRTKEILELAPYDTVTLETFDPETSKRASTKTNKKLNTAFAKLQADLRKSLDTELQSTPAEPDVPDETPEDPEEIVPTAPIETPEQEWARLQKGLQ